MTSPERKLDAILGLVQQMVDEIQATLGGINRTVTDVKKSNTLIVSQGGHTIVSSLGPEMSHSVFVSGTEATTLGLTQNSPLVYPFTLNSTVSVKRVWWANGGTVTGNIDVGVYDQDLVRVLSAGSTAQGSANTIQFADVTDTSLTAGRYYLAVTADNVNSDFRGLTSVVPTPSGVGAFSESSAFPLPVGPLTPDGTGGVTQIIMCGLTSSATLTLPQYI